MSGRNLPSDLYKVCSPCRYRLCAPKDSGVLVMSDVLIEEMVSSASSIVALRIRRDGTISLLDYTHQDESTEIAEAQNIIDLLRAKF